MSKSTSPLGRQVLSGICFTRDVQVSSVIHLAPLQVLSDLNVKTLPTSVSINMSCILTLPGLLKRASQFLNIALR